MRTARIISAQGTVTVQDMGRTGWLAQGLSRGGAVDPLAVFEGAALLGQDSSLAVIELMSGSLRLRVDQPTRIALTGAPMRAQLGGSAETRSLAWHCSHLIPSRAELSISPGPDGGFGYLHFGGGLAVEQVMGARSVHLAAGIGGVLKPTDILPLGEDPGSSVDLVIDPLPRFDGGTLRAVESLQTPLFPPEQVARLQDTVFSRDNHGNRMGARLDPGGAEPFSASDGLNIVSEIVQPGDIQITGDGTPFVLLAECQTTGGYPRIATILPCDLPIVAQAPQGAALRIRMIDREAGLAAMRAYLRDIDGLTSRIGQRRRDPAQMGDLLSYNLIGGVVDAAQPDHFHAHIHHPREKS
ncbi:biotin-dependent carboxyltransferase family protein [Paracoccus aerodenitrificans]|uniref:5-oxoprolinase subunit C family protein n=1 Tax=Paracoccus aerodenitrificans TaxID=3017781 RepID=UPI0022F0D764|nr:biotin-dependent carboxyltransferase family protein [Paracoccus aerodenitrificans]WBU63990.1 biotin-dependent carboxyltransferase family protein [Paracoccus aerodenitrificans]